MLHFRSSNAKSQCPESPVRAGVAIAANDGHPRLRQPEFRPDHMHDSLIRRIHVKQPHPEFFTVGLERRNLLGGNEIGNRSSARLGRNIVVDRGHRPRRLAYVSSRYPQSIEGLGRSHFMHQMQIDIDDRRPAFRLRYQMRIPDLFEKCSPRGHPNFLIYFLPDKNPSTPLANSSEKPNLVFAREYTSTAFLSSQIIVDFIQ